MKTWAFSIASRVVADHFRQPANRVDIVEIDESEPFSEAERSVDDQLVIDEMSVCVRKVIDSLPEDYGVALVLHDLEGMTAEQTAQICDCSLPTAKIRIHRARRRLREALPTGVQALFLGLQPVEEIHHLDVELVPAPANQVEVSRSETGT